MAHTDMRGDIKLWSEDACKADVLTVLAAETGGEPGDADLDDDLEHDLAVDMGDLVGALETHFAIDIPIDHADAWSTVLDVQTYMWRRIKTRNPPSQIKPVVN